MIEYLKLLFYFNNFLVAFLHYQIGDTGCGGGMFYKLPIYFFITSYLKLIFNEWKWNSLGGLMEGLNILQIVTYSILIFGISCEEFGDCSQQCQNIAYYTRLWYGSIFLSMPFYM